MKSLIDLTGTESTLTPNTPTQQVTVGNIPTSNPNFSRAIQLSNQAVFIKRVAFAVAYSLDDLVALAVTIEPGLTYAPIFTTQPGDQTVDVSAPATFTVVINTEFPAVDAPTYQWQESTDSGATFSDVTDGGIYSGATTASLVVTPADTSPSGFWYRCVATNLSGSTNSTSGLLTVNPP